MEQQRAREIVNSADTIYVTYQNIPVWIDAVKENGQADIRDLNSDLKLTVPVKELLETGELGD